MKTPLMKKVALLAVIATMTPLLASAQSRISIAPMAGFYKAKLDKTSEALSEVEKIGFKVQRPNGGLQVGGRLNYEKSPRLTLRVEVSSWQDQATGNFQASDGTVDFENQLRLIPIMLGAQYNLNAPSAKIRLYAGVSSGVVLVQTKFQMTVQLNTPNAQPDVTRSELSGNDFMGKPFLGLELATSRNLALFSELGYVFGKFTTEEVDPQSGSKNSEDTSLNGLHLMGGVKLSF